jgi:hypothetical protein
MIPTIHRFSQVFLGKAPTLAACLRLVPATHMGSAQQLEEDAHDA